MTDIRYVRARTRVGTLPLSTRLFQGLGALPDTWKNFAFNTFLLFYYNQVLGLTASLASAAIMIALIVDAITDPMAGSISDNWRSRLGRRHPFIYASIVPMAVCFFALFSPPDLGQFGLFLWLLTFAVL
ncbi:MAG: MFS transporter, partial [Gammaproteobacteria bacterium]